MHVNRTIGPILTYRFHEKRKENDLAPDGHRRRVAPRTLYRSDSPHRDLSLHPHHRSGRASPERRTVRPGRRTIGRRNPDSDRKRCDRPDGRQSVPSLQSLSAAGISRDLQSVGYSDDQRIRTCIPLARQEPGPAPDPALFPLRRGSRTQLRPVGSRCTPSGLGLPSLLRRRSRRTDLRARHARHERHAVLDPRSDRLAACGGIPPGAGRVDRSRIRRGDRRHAGCPEDRPLFRRTGHCFRRRL